MSDIEFNKSIKIILLGETSTGKTNLINSFFDIPFDTTSRSTIAPNLSPKVIVINEHSYTINMWDTVGQERYHSITKHFINGSNIIILVYDICNEESFNKLTYWDNSVRDILGDDIILGICGNKKDLVSNKTVEKQKGIEFAESKGALFAETSAKNDPKGFQQFVAQLVEKYLDKNGIKINDSKKLFPELNSNKKKKCFC